MGGVSRLPFPAVCLVTDRLRFPGALSTRERLTRAVSLIEYAAIGGVDIVQIRERDLAARDLLELVRRAIAVTRGTAARVVVNERLDVALAAGAAGVHLRGDSITAAEVRRIAPKGFLVGRSVHDVSGAIATVASGGVDYVIYGTVFPSVSKPTARVAGVDELRRLVSAVGVPVLAIGGVTLERVPLVAAAGAGGFAAIGLFQSLDSETMVEVVSRAKRAFDIGRPLP
jgi:thiamine-phosphate diphosphorylase